MAKKIKVEVDLEDKQAKKKLEDLTNKKYKVDLDVDSNGVKNVNEQVQKLGNTASSTTTVFGKLKNAISNTFSFNKITTTGYLAVLNEINQAGKNALFKNKNIRSINQIGIYIFYQLKPVRCIKLFIFQFFNNAKSNNHTMYMCF